MDGVGRVSGWGGWVGGWVGVWGSKKGGNLFCKKYMCTWLHKHVHMASWGHMTFFWALSGSLDRLTSHGATTMLL